MNSCNRDQVPHSGAGGPSNSVKAGLSNSVNNSKIELFSFGSSGPRSGKVFQRD